MSNRSQSAARARAFQISRYAYRLAIAVVLIVCLVFTPSTAMAQPKKKKEEAAPTKSYVLPYFIVMMLVGVGLMTVCRPGYRKDRPPDKKHDED